MIIPWVANKVINKEKVDYYLNQTALTRHFTNYGPSVQILEQKVREFFDIEDNKCVIAVTNGSVAVHILAAAIGYEKKKKLNWATQSFTFPPSAQANLKNVSILDIDLDTGGLDMESVNSSIDGVIVTNIFGNIVDLDKYEKWAQENNKALIFDNAATCGTQYKGKNALNYGNGCGISFHHTKPFGFGEGGAIIADLKYEKYIRGLINFGIGLDQEHPQFTPEGTNGKMSDISAAYILGYLETNLNNIKTKLNDFYYHFKNELQRRNITVCRLYPSFHDEGQIVPACICLLFSENRDMYLSKLSSVSACRKYYHPLKKMPNVNKVYESIICLPCNIDMTIDDLNSFLDIIENN